MEEAGEVDVQGYYEEEEEEEEDVEEGGGKEFYDFEPLPTLLEDEENVSLADILSLRDNGLTEQEIWAICLECCYSMKSICHSAIFQTLCVTPDTLAFNTNGKVCFMEQLSDDPEGDFVPPEFDLTGNTLEAHIYSLGATLKAAIEFVIEPEMETEMCQDVNSLLDLMQQESPADRPDIESIISLCEEKLGSSSSYMICRSLSSIGRRVLSIESVAALQDGLENLWKGANKMDKGVKHQTGEKDPNQVSCVSRCSDIYHDLIASHAKEQQNGWREAEINSEKPRTGPPSVFLNHVKKHRGERTHPSSLEKYDHREKPNDEMSRLSLKRYRRSKNHPIDNTLEKRSLSLSPPATGRATLKSWPSVPSCLSPNDCVEDQEDHLVDRDQRKPENLCFMNSKINDNCFFPCNPAPSPRNCNSPLDPTEFRSQVSYENLVAAFEEENMRSLSKDKNTTEERASSGESRTVCYPSNGSEHSKVHEGPPSFSVYHDDSAPVSRRNSLEHDDEDKIDQQWIPLKDILIRYGQPLKEDELWALCHECLYTLQTYIDFPAILCLESVLVDPSGEVLFVFHPDEEPYDAFCVPPEFDPQGLGTEKACVYGIAAILWSAAKLNYPSNHKLALPKKLKKFLLHMAKRNAEERPGLAEALQVCRDYLVRKGIDSKVIWADIYKFTYKSGPHAGYEEPLSTEDPRDFPGFIPVSTTNKLMAVKGPVPLKNERSKLPAAFTSPATHFKPIILMQNTENCSEKNANSSSCNEEFEDGTSKATPGQGISGSDMESYEDKTSLIYSCNIPSRIQSSNPRDSTISCCSSDRKENISSEGSVSSNSSTVLSSPVVNNYLLKQDPKTGSLKLVRVQLSIPEHIASVSLETEPVPRCIGTPATVANNDISSYDIKNCEELLLPSLAVYRGTQTKVNDVTGELPLSNGMLAPSSNGDQTLPVVNYNNDASVAQLNAANGEAQAKRTICSPLLKIMHLIRDEFSFDGYLENGIEDLAMGEYIFSLGGLQYTTFCGAICEKFCDLYWDDQLLENLYQVVNGKSPSSISTNTKDASSPCIATQMLKRVQRKSRKYKKQEHSSANEQINSIKSEEIKPIASDAAVTPENQISSESQSLPSFSDAGTETQEAADDGRQASFEEGDMTDCLPETAETDEQSQTSDVAKQSEGDCAYRALSDCKHFRFSPDFTDENEDNLEVVKPREGGFTMSICPEELYKCSMGWSSAFYGAQLFDSEVQRYVNILGRQKDKCSESIEAKRLELEQQLMIETKNYRKTIKLYQNLLLKGKRNKGSDVKELLPKLKGHLEEMKAKVQFLELSKKLLQVSHAEQWGVEPSTLPSVATLTRSESILNPDDDPAFLLIYNHKGKASQNSTSKSLQAGTPLGLMVYLYSCNAVLDGYVQQFLYTFRYFSSQDDLLQFFIDAINSTFPRENTNSSPLDEKVYHRSLVLLQMWLEDCYIDFLVNPDLLDKLEELSNSQILPKDERGDHLLSLLQEVSSRKYTISSPSASDKKDDTKSLHSLCTRLSEDNVSRKSFNWKLSRVNGPNAFHQKDKQYNISLALPRPCYPNFAEDFSLSYIKGDESGTYSILECSVQHISSQLTLLQEEMFQKCHPVHFLNSRALGVKDKSANVSKNSYAETAPADIGSLFLPNCAQDKYLLQLLRFADNVSSWVAAEIVTSATPKLQASVLTKFLLVAKLCYEQRDFATAVQILGGLENLIVRQLPAWKSLPNKVCEILEELKAVEVFLKSDSLCLMKGDRFRTLPTIPSAYLLAMHVQQLETGGFTMANGAYKWNKLRNIAKVVSQVHAFQEIPYSFGPDPELQFYLRQRIAHFSDADISALAAANNTNFHHMPSEKHSRKIQDTLRRMKATFQ
ncbi:kinase non-catalytic C-lobe domain-containing protein 1 [Spea bombifrons]|uniref:kinase non-catalytic C-lobe domain-containing protein 1 n=1 Tax=Spea bombifrons TaxID=233779 RepID=UPI00234BE529|nr:kinase non-catalytic C-lobe domain-containing protein 1 [Spea bombifrons]